METAERFWAKVNKNGECWEWTAALKGEYGYFGLYGKMVLSHRLSYVLHHPLTIDLLEGHREICVCHKCDNPRCVNPSHLFLGSNADNVRDKEAKGRGTRGVKNSQSKLTEIQVREIRMKYANGGISQRQLALEYGVSQTTIGEIVRREIWSHITEHN